MSGAWRKTLIYLGLVEEPEEHDELPERFDQAPQAMDRSSGGQHGGGPGPGGSPNDDGKVRALRFPATDDGGTGRGGPPWDRNRSSPSTQRTQSRAGSGRESRSQAPPRTRTEDVRVRIVDVRGFGNCEEIGEIYLEGQPVLFDLGRIETGLGRRVLDFVSGVTFALQGSLTRVGARAFLLVPEGVSVPPEERRRLADLGYRAES